MSEYVESQTAQEEVVEAATIEGIADTPVVEMAAAEAMVEGGAETVVEAAAAESNPPTSANSVVESVRTGASAAQEAATNFLPVVGKTLQKWVYNGFYYVSFGVTFSALTVAKLVPTDNVMGQALADGAEAAKEAFRAEHHTAASEAPTTSDEGLVAA